MLKLYENIMAMPSAGWSFEWDPFHLILLRLQSIFSLISLHKGFFINNFVYKALKCISCCLQLSLDQIFWSCTTTTQCCGGEWVASCPLSGHSQLILMLSWAVTISFPLSSQLQDSQSAVESSLWQLQACQSVSLLHKSLVIFQWRPDNNI
jgi:hypothetical protein